MKYIKGRLTRVLAKLGFTLIIAMLSAAVVLHLGAGSRFDYFVAEELSFGLIENVRSIAVTLCAGCIGIEYLQRQAAE